MVRKNEELRVVCTEHKFGGPGFSAAKSLITGPAELNNKGRVFTHLHLEPGSGVGYHEHHGDMEIFYILSGHGTYNDNGTIVPVGPGDVTFCPSGAGHALTADDEPLDYIALVLFE